MCCGFVFELPPKFMYQRLVLQADDARSPSLGSDQLMTTHSHSPYDDGTGALIGKDRGDWPNEDTERKHPLQTKQSLPGHQAGQSMTLNFQLLVPKQTKLFVYKLLVCGFVTTAEPT